MKRLLTSILIVFVFHATTIAQDYSLRDILAAPYSTDLIKSSDNLSLAWVTNQAGVRSVMLAQGPNFESKSIISSLDDGQVIGNLKFDPSDSYIYYVKGSGPNRSGQSANPLGYTDYPTAILHRKHIKLAQADEIGPYTNYLFSPKSNSIITWSRNSMSSMNMDGSEPKELFKIRGEVSQPLLSADSVSIIFTSQRGDHSFIGLYSTDSNRIHWLSPSVDRDSHPQWSPDGKKVAFIRAPGIRRGEKLNITGGNPFSIVIHDIEKDKSETIWSSPSDDGGFAQYYHNEPLRWSKGGDLLFYSEHEGYMKIYAMNEDGGEVRSVIGGACEVEHSNLTDDQQELIFSSNCGDIDRRDIFSYDLTINTLEQITTTVDIETNPIPFGANRIAIRKSNHNTPTGIAILSNGKSKTIFPKKQDDKYPKDQLIQPEQVIFKAQDGTEVHGQLFAKNKSTKQPAVIFMHGGPTRQMLLGYHYSGYYANAYAMNQYLASQGYVVLSVNFRAGIGYGKDFRRAVDQGPRGASEYQDILSGAALLQSLSYVDEDKIGLWGGSYGGFLTAMGLARNSNIFKAGVDFHGVHDWAWRGIDFSDGGAWGLTEELMEEAYRSSPVADVDTWKSPVLMIHGDDDRNVMFGQTIDLVQKLRERKVHTEVLVLPDEVHGFYRWESWCKSFEATADFFDRFLKK